MNLPEIYARVCAKRADAELAGLEHMDEGIWSIPVPQIEIEDEDHDPAEAWKGEEPQTIDAAIVLSTPMAAALIESHWMDLLPDRVMVMRQGDRWSVAFINRSLGCLDTYGSFPTRIEALAAYLEATAK